MVTRRVFIVWSHSLFRETVRLLLDNPTIEIVGMGSNYEEIIAKIQQSRPDTIIVEETEDDAVAQIEALQIFKENPAEGRVIRLSLHDNELWVYHHQRRSIDNTEEFLRIVQDT